MKSKINDLSIDDLIPSFKTSGMNLGLERISNALNAIGNPCRNIPAIQVAGTNGKGSITSFIESLSIEKGIKVGVSTSPHLTSWCERIRVNGKAISEPDIKERIIKLKSFIEVQKLTPFELIITTAFDYFEELKVDLLILEVGLGGRLDATTIHPLRPIVAMATIGLDHCEYLGNDLNKIAKEKAAVITQRATVISAKQAPVVEKVLKERASQKEAKIKWVEPIPKDWKLGLPGNFQRKNAAVAKGAAEALADLGWEINESSLRQGMADASWPGRLEKAKWQGLPILIDCAHNPPAAEELSKERLIWPKQANGINWVLGIQAHKAAPQMLKSLIHPSDIVWIVPVPGKTSWTSSKIAQALPDIASQIRQANSVKHAFTLLSMKKEWPIPPPVVAGSIFLIGDLLSKQIISN